MQWRRTFVAHVPIPGVPRAKLDRAAHRGSKGVLRSSRVALRPLGCGQDNSLWTAALGAITPRKDETVYPSAPSLSRDRSSSCNVRLTRTGAHPLSTHFQARTCVRAHLRALCDTRGV
jgi:hypothetical protein